MSDSLTIKLDRKHWNHVSLAWSYDIKITAFYQKRKCSHSTSSRLKGDIILLIHYNYYSNVLNPCLKSSNYPITCHANR